MNIIKKIYFVFGQPGSGRKTLFQNVISKSSNICKILNIESARIACNFIQYDRESLFHNYETVKKRLDTMYKLINKFLKSDDEVLFLTGEYIDYADNVNNILKIIANTFLNCDKEIILLSLHDLEIFFERMKESGWFKSNYQINIKRFPKEWLSFALNHMRESLYDYIKDGYKISEIDTTFDYTVINKENIKTLALFRK